MQLTSIEYLNSTFAIKDQLVFTNGRGNMTMAKIHNQACSAEIYLHGGHVTSYIPNGEEPVLWLAPNASFRPDHPIRGGIPVCWPWFGKHPDDKSKPAHGFARIETWNVRHARRIDDITTELCLSLGDNEHTLGIWPHKFYLQLKIIAGTSLSLELTTINTGNLPITITGALHSYFTVGDSSSIRISGLDKTCYHDETDDARYKTQDGDVIIASETDRTYIDTETDCIINDPALARKIKITKKGSRTSVVWNPWIEKSKTMTDLSAGDYKTMVCVETAKARNDVAIIKPGEECRMSAEIFVLRQ